MWKRERDMARGEAFRFKHKLLALLIIEIFWIILFLINQTEKKYIHEEKESIIRNCIYRQTWHGKKFFPVRFVIRMVCEDFVGCLTGWTCTSLSSHTPAYFFLYSTMYLGYTCVTISLLFILRYPLCLDLSVFFYVKMSLWLFYIKKIKGI